MALARVENFKFFVHLLLLFYQQLDLAPNDMSYIFRDVSVMSVSVFQSYSVSFSLLVCLHQSVSACPHLLVCLCRIFTSHFIFFAGGFSGGSWKLSLVVTMIPNRNFAYSPIGPGSAWRSFTFCWVSSSSPRIR